MSVYLSFYTAKFCQNVNCCTMQRSTWPFIECNQRTCHLPWFGYPGSTEHHVCVLFSFILHRKVCSQKCKSTPGNTKMASKSEFWCHFCVWIVEFTFELKFWPRIFDDQHYEAKTLEAKRRKVQWLRGLKFCMLPQVGSLQLWLNGLWYPRIAPGARNEYGLTYQWKPLTHNWSAFWHFYRLLLV